MHITAKAMEGLEGVCKASVRGQKQVPVPTPDRALLAPSTPKPKHQKSSQEGHWYNGLPPAMGQTTRLSSLCPQNQLEADQKPKCHLKSLIS